MCEANISKVSSLRLYLAVTAKTPIPVSAKWVLEQERREWLCFTQDKGSETRRSVLARLLAVHQSSVWKCDGPPSVLDSTLHHPVSTVYCPLAASCVPLLLLTLQQHAIHRQAPLSPDTADPARFVAQLWGPSACYISHVEWLAPSWFGVQR